MKISKRQLKRIIREEKRALQEQEVRDDIYVGTLFSYALQLCHDKYSELIETEAGESTYIADLVCNEHSDHMVEVLCDHWIEGMTSFQDYPGNEDALWEALRGPAELVVEEACVEFRADFG